MDKFDLAASIAALRNSGPPDDALIGLPELAGMLARTWRLELSEASKLMLEQLHECSDELPLYRRYANSRPVLLSAERTPMADEDYPGRGHKFYPSSRDQALNDLPLACTLGHRLGEAGTAAEGARSLGLVRVAALQFFGLDGPLVISQFVPVPAPLLLKKGTEAGPVAALCEVLSHESGGEPVAGGPVSLIAVAGAYPPFKGAETRRSNPEFCKAVHHLRQVNQHLKNPTETLATHYGVSTKHIARCAKDGELLVAGSPLVKSGKAEKQLWCSSVTSGPTTRTGSSKK